MEIHRKVISLSSDIEELIIGNYLQSGVLLANQYKVHLLLKKEPFIASYACEDINTSETVVIYHVSEKISCNNDFQTKIGLYLSELASLDSKHLFTDYQLLALSPKETFIVAKYPIGNNISKWRTTHDLNALDNRLALKRFLLDAASGLDYLHSRGMLHGCVCPENMLITNENTLLLLNAGLASFLKQQSRSKQKKYNENEQLSYRAPELFNMQEADTKTEQYAFGATVYELISGKKPYDWVRADLFKKVVLSQEPDPPADVTKKESSAIMRALNRNPQKRYSSCRHFIKALTPFKPSQLQKKIFCIGIILLFFTTFGVVVFHIVNQTKERARIAHINGEARIEELHKEAENQRKNNEAGQLQWKSNAVLTEILSREFDTGQTFGEHLKKAQDKYAAGVKAIESGQRTEAYTLFAESLDNSEWIRNNVESRVSVGQMLQRVFVIRDNSKEKSEELFPHKWDIALDKLNTATALYEAGEFKQAESALKETETIFLNIADEVKAFMKKQYVEFAEKALQEQNWELLQEYAAKIEEFDTELGKKYYGKATAGIKLKQIATELLTAQNQSKSHNWPAVIAHCDAILKLDANNVKAMEMRDEAILASTCNLQAITKIADETAICSIEINEMNVPGNTNDVIRNLPVNKKNKIRFVCHKDGIQFEWEGTIDCSWMGVRKIDFQLEKSVILLTDKAKEAFKNNKWEDLLSLASKILQLDAQSELALEYKERAELELSCNVDIVPLISDTVIKAEYGFNSQKHHTGVPLRNLQKDKDYTLELYAELDGTRYEGICKFHANWNGIKQLKVTMKKTTEVLLQKARTALQNKAWDDARQNAQKVLEILPMDVAASRILDEVDLESTSSDSGKNILSNNVVAQNDFNGTVMLPGNVKLEMICVKSGSFTMGSPPGEDERCDDEIQHRVTLTKDFWLGKYEVTQEQWQAVMIANPSYFKGTRLPVENVSWFGANAFCRELNVLYGSKLPFGYCFGLPSDAQWEYACRAGTKTAYSFGNTCNGFQANCNGYDPYGITTKGLYRKESCEVGRYTPNAWGFYDMHGNVSEWCSDWKGSNFGDAIDPQGPTTGFRRVMRGGGWNSSAWCCRAAHRYDTLPGNRYCDLGFRLALVPIQ